MSLPFPVCEDGYFELTPELAERLLKTARPNRPVRAGRVSWLKRQIEIGRYHSSARFLGFNEDDQLVDGNHLCTAVVEAQIAVQTRAARVKQSDVLAVDTGASRTAADLVQLRGIEHAATLVACLRLVRSIEACEGVKRLNPEAGRMLSNEEVWEQIQSETSLIDSTAAAQEIAKYIPFLSTSHVAAVHHLIRARGGEDQALAFWEDLTDPVEDTMLFKLRRQLIAAQSAQRKPPRLEMLARLAQAWNRWADDRRTGGVPIPRKFPVIKQVVAEESVAEESV